VWSCSSTIRALRRCSVCGTYPLCRRGGFKFSPLSAEETQVRLRASMAVFSRAGSLLWGLEVIWQQITGSRWDPDQLSQPLRIHVRLRSSVLRHGGNLSIGVITFVAGVLVWYAEQSATCCKGQSSSRRDVTATSLVILRRWLELIKMIGLCSSRVNILNPWEFSWAVSIASNICCLWCTICVTCISYCTLPCVPCIQGNMPICSASLYRNDWNLKMLKYIKLMTIKYSIILVFKICNNPPLLPLLSCLYVCVCVYIYIYIYIQGVPGGMCQTSGGCSLW